MIIPEVRRQQLQAACNIDEDISSTLPISSDSTLTAENISREIVTETHKYELNTVQKLFDMNNNISENSDNS